MMMRQARKSMRRALWLPAVVIIVAIAPMAATAESRVAEGSRTEAAATPAGPEQIELVVTGLSCPFCAYGLEKRLRSEITDLDDFQIDAATGRVSFRVKDGSKLTEERPRKIVRDAGFTAQQIERRAQDGRRPA
jgi:hypothetical protein